MRLCIETIPKMQHQTGARGCLPAFWQARLHRPGYSETPGKLQSGRCPRQYAANSASSILAKTESRSPPGPSEQLHEERAVQLLSRRQLATSASLHGAEKPIPPVVTRSADNTFSDGAMRRMCNKSARAVL